MTQKMLLWVNNSFSKMTNNVILEDSLLTELTIGRIENHSKFESFMKEKVAIGI